MRKMRVRNEAANMFPALFYLLLSIQYHLTFHSLMAAWYEYLKITGNVGTLMVAVAYTEKLIMNRKIMEKAYIQKLYKTCFMCMPFIIAC